METFDILTKVNFWSVLLAAVSYLIVGSLWYSPLLFGKLWIKLNGFCDEDLKSSRPLWKILILSFLSAVVSSFVIAAVLGPRQSPDFGAVVGAIIAICWITMSKLTDVLFENKPVKLFFLHAGFDLVSFMIMGAIVGYWR